MSYRMTIPLSNVVTARVVLLAALLLGGLVAAVSLYHSVYAQETIEYPENGEGPVAAYTAVDPEGDGVIWTLSGTDADDFSIEGGVLKFESSPNYESPTSSVATGTLDQKNTYTVTVEATDTEATKNMLPVIVKVTNVDEPGEATLSTQQPLEELALTAALSDPDGANSESWQWSRSSSANGPWTDIRDATTAAHTPTADDVDRYLLATASYNDGEGKYKSAAVVSANPVQMKLYVNQAPVFQDAEGNEISGAQTIGRSVAEDAAAGGAVGGPVAATDTVGEVLTYSLSGTDAASFDIDSATGQITVDAGTLDFETKKTHDVTVTATDPLGLTDTIGVTITVTDVDEAPMVTGGATVKYHPENTPVATSVSTYTATDDDDDNNEPKKPRKWSLSGADSDKFEISAVSGSNSTTDAELTFKASPDFEAKASAGGNNIYVLTVVATDSGGQTASRDVTVRVTNVEEEGTVTLSSLQPEVGVALTASLTDPDGEISGLTWQWARADTMGGSYTAIAGATSAVYTPVSADDAKYLRATASYTDGEGSGKSQSEESANLVQPHDTTNVAPVFSPKTVSISVPESTTGNLGAAVTATDDDNLTYSLGGSDASSFTIDRSSGQIKVAAGTLDYETKQTHNVTVTATDASLESDTATVTITVTNVNEKPTLAGPASISHDENTANTEAVADYTAADPEGTQIFWALTGNDNGDFSISTSGVLTFVASPDYEDPADTGTDNVYNVTVEASDTNSNTSTLSVTVTVTNLDEDGTVTFTSLQPKVDVELTAMLTDPDGGTTNTAWQWSKSSSASGSWTDIMGATAEAYTPVAGDMDSYLRATASYDDGEGKYKTAAAVSDNAVEPEVPVNRTPAFEDADGDEIATTTREVAENTAADGNVGAPVAARDPDNDTLTYTLGDTDADEFTIDSGTGQVGVGDGTELNFETKQSYTVTVTATDPSGDDVTITVTIGVTDVDEDPSLTGPSEVFHAEDTATTTVATYAATDDEDDNDAPSKSLKWSLSGADADDFSIAAGGLKFESKPDYEAPTDTGSNNMYDITVEAIDSDGNTASKDVTVTVTNVEEDGEVILLSLQPQDGIPLRAELTDPDGGVSGVTWKWEWSDPGSGGCSNASIIGCPSPEITPSRRSTRRSRLTRGTA